MKTSNPTRITSKASKGSVVVENFKNRLRLRWRYLGKRFSLSLGLADTVENRKLAEAKAKTIESDMAYERFPEIL